MRSTVAIYAFGHFAVDFGSVFFLSTVAGRSGLEPTSVYACYLVYALLAFGTQPFLGLVGDRFQRPRALAGAGLALVLGGLPLVGLPWAGVGLVGLGNALFHLGGGTVTANLAPARAKLLGLFVAPGALGLLLAPLVARSQETPLLPAAALACSLALLAFHGTEGDYPRADNPLRSGVLLGLLLVVALRSGVGSAVVFPWKAELPLLALLTLGVVLGKALGGGVGDRLGWRRTAVGSLLASLALIPFGAAWPALGILAMLLFNFTMPIVLAALVREMPRNPGFAFGLNCLALLAGAVPLFHPVAVPLPVVAGGILLSAVLLLVALEDPR